MKTNATFAKSMELLDDMRMLSARIDHLFSILDPGQHQHFNRVSAKLKESNVIYKILSQLDPTFFHGRSIVYNRETEEHVDNKSKKMAWIPILTLGKYSKGTLTVLGRDIDYLPGTLVCIRGAVLPHRSAFSGGQSIELVHHMHSDLVDDVSPGPLPIEYVSEMESRLRQESEARSAKDPDSFE